MQKDKKEDSTSPVMNGLIFFALKTYYFIDTSNFNLSIKKENNYEKICYSMQL